jgi:hypothetical protein
MPTPAVPPIRRLPDGTPFHHRPLAALPAIDYARTQRQLHMNTGMTGRTLQAHGTPVTDAYFPNEGCSPSRMRCVMGRSSTSRP